MAFHDNPSTRGLWGLKAHQATRLLRSDQALCMMKRYGLPHISNICHVVCYKCSEVQFQMQVASIRPQFNFLFVLQRRITEISKPKARNVTQVDDSEGQEHSMWIQAGLEGKQDGVGVILKGECR